MSKEVTFPRHASHEARMKLEHAEAVVDAFCEFYADVAAVFSRRIPAAQNADALKIRRAWLRASA